MRSIFTTILLIAAFSMAAVAQKPEPAKSPEAKPTPEVKLPSSAEIIEKYVKAIGGREALKGKTSMFVSASIELSPMGVKGTAETFVRSDNRLFIKTSLAGIGDFLIGYDGQKGWTSNPVQGLRVQQGRELLQTKRLATFDREYSFDKLYTSIKVRGLETVGDRKTYVLVGSSAELPDDVYYFDTETGMLLRSDTVTVAPEGDQPSTTFFEDYRDVEGTKIPFKTRSKTPTFEIVTAVTEVKYNVPIDEAKLAQPK